MLNQFSKETFKKAMERCNKAGKEFKPNIKRLTPSIGKDELNV